MGDLTGSAYDQCISQFEGDWADTLVVQVEEHIVRSAAEIVFTYGLRAYDSVQLAAARYFHKQSGEALTFACFDKRLNAAARSSGLRLLVH